MISFASEFTMTIDGKGVPGASTIPIINPATGESFAHGSDSSREQLDMAVRAAREALPDWSSTPFAVRSGLVASMANALTGDLDGLHRLLTREQGKPHADAQAELMTAAYWCQTTARLELPAPVVEDTPERHGWTRHVPIGVVGAIAPWNFPVVLAFFKIAPALLAGNTVVLKPSPLTPLTTLKIGELLRGVLPDGVFNIVSGGDELGPWMTSHPGIDKISFTGSTQTDRKVMASAADTLKRLTLELGGNDAAIVMPDVDVAAIAEPLFWAAFRNSGQICIAAKRIYIHKDVYEPLRDALVAYAKTVKMGDGAAPGVQLGPIQNRQQYARVLELIADAKARGCKFLVGGEVDSAPGYFVPVSIIDNPPEDCRVVREEQFGPVLPLLQFEHVEDAITRANAGEHGLGMSVWSADIDLACAIAAGLRAGTVWINECQYLSPFAAFGGQKQSGLGVEGGVQGLLEYTTTQTTFVKRGPPP